jgi:hypothetical protein
MRTACVTCLLVATAVIPLATVHAEDIATLYNTGVDSSGVSVADNTPDPHWSLVAPSPVTGTPLVASSVGGFPIPPWLADSADSAWTTTLNTTPLGPGSNTNAGVFADYHYQTTFSLAGLNPSTAVIAGRVSYDNFLQDVLVNGTSTGIQFPAENPGASFGGWENFALDASDIALLSGGDNTLTFVVRSAQADGADDYTGLRVEFTTATAELIPEPSSLIILATGLAFLGVRRRAL